MEQRRMSNIYTKDRHSERWKNLIPILIVHSLFSSSQVIRYSSHIHYISSHHIAIPCSKRSNTLSTPSISCPVILFSMLSGTPGGGDIGATALQFKRARRENA